MALAFDIVDVFCDRPFAGNPLAVVHSGEGLSTSQMQSIAAEFNLSETVFVLAPTGAADYRVRIFTPTGELPFAGHPSLGAAWVLARDGRIGWGARVQECAAGMLPVTVDREGARIGGGAPTVGQRRTADALLAAVGLQPGDAVGSVAPGVAGAGNEFAVVVVDRSAVARAVPDVAAVRAATEGLTGVIVAAVDDSATDVHLRVFAPAVGVLEDPATGSAAVAFGVFLASRGLTVRDGVHEFVVSQGAEVGRPSRLHGSVTTVDGRAVSSAVAGEVSEVGRGELTALPAP